MKWIFALKYECVIMWFSVTPVSVSNIAAILVSAFSLHSSGGATRTYYSIFKHVHVPGTLWNNLILKNLCGAKIKARCRCLTSLWKFSYILTKATFILLQVKISRF